MRDALHVDQRPEIRIDSHEDAPFGRRPFQQGVIPWVWSHLPGREDIMPLGPEPRGQALPGAPIHQKFHGVVTVTASSVSPAMTACA
jgi:hypothetical protein